MKKGFFIGLRPGEKIYINGAVIRVDRKATLELLNDVAFLLESHVLQLEETTSPLRQLYFVVQSMLMDPASAENMRPTFENMCLALLASFEDQKVASKLVEIRALVNGDKAFEALKSIRALYPIEAEIMSAERPAASPAAVRNQ